MCCRWDEESNYVTTCPVFQKLNIERRTAAEQLFVLPFIFNRMQYYVVSRNG